MPRQLPAPPRWFKGRQDELRLLSAVADLAPKEGSTVAISAIGGMGGIGKTALALHWAYQNLDRFPDGQLYVNLRGFDPSGLPVPPSGVLHAFLDALGVEPHAIPNNLEARSALYRTQLAERRVLVIADNARDFPQVEPLIPGSQTCALLVTSRNQISELRLRGAELLRLGLLDNAEAEQIMTDQLGAERIATEIGSLDDLLGPCGGLPLAIGVVAGRAMIHPEFSLEVLAEELRESSALLDNLELGDPYGSLRTVFSWSYSTLSPAAASAFRLIGTIPGSDIGVNATAALTSQSLDRTKTTLLLLENSSLLQQYRPHRYRMHDLLRLYAAERMIPDESSSVQSAALKRFVDHYLYTAYAGDRLIAEYRRPIDLGPATEGCRPDSIEDDPAAMTWFSTEHPNILAAQGVAASRGWLERVWQFAWVLDSFHWRRGHLFDDIDGWEAGLAAAERLADPFAIGLARRRLGRAYGRANRYQLARDHMTVGLALAEQADDIPGQAHAHRIFAWIWHHLDNDETALTHASTSLTLYQALGNPVWEAHALNELGVCHMRLGHSEAATDCCERALALHREHHHTAGEAESLDSLGVISAARGQCEEALRYYQDALVEYRLLGNTYDEAIVLDHLGHVFVTLNRHAEARQAWQDALDLYSLKHRTAEADRMTEKLGGYGHRL